MYFVKHGGGCEKGYIAQEGASLVGNQVHCG